MIRDVPNIQQLVDTHIYEALTLAFGKDAPGDPWQDDPSTNVKMKYAIKQEYRTLSPTEVTELVKGQTHSSLGVIIIGNTRWISTPLDLNGKKYGSRLETLVYNCAMNYRQSSIGGDRLAYHMNRDYFQVMTDNPFDFNHYNIPFVLSATESEFTDTEMDVQRITTIIPSAQLR